MSLSITEPSSPTPLTADDRPIGDRLHPDHQPVELSIIIVSWNVWPLLRDCLQSIAALTKPTVPVHHDSRTVRWFGEEAKWRLEVIVVDNDSSDATGTRLPLEFPWVRLIHSGGNVAFTRGNNLGYRASRGAYVFFLNPDTSLTAAPCVAAEHDTPAKLPTSAQTTSAPENPLILLHR
ncbi:MAG: glycosyltransferase, partial [Caldilineaceae bacterium]|nr:glycosyltransferase [Caldilineaceae bacterium]